MTTDDATVEKTVSLPAALAHSIERIAEAEGMTVNELIVGILWQIRAERAHKQLSKIQEYGQRRVEALGIFTETDLWTYLES